MLRMLSLTLSMALAAACPALPALAQDGPLKIEITDGVTEPMAIAIPAFHGDAAVAQQIRDVVAADLTGTGLFREIPRDAQVARPDSFGEAIAYEDWRAINAEALVIGDVAMADGMVTVRFRLFDVFSGRPLGDGVQGWGVAGHDLWTVPLRSRHRVSRPLHRVLATKGERVTASSHGSGATFLPDAVTIRFLRLPWSVSRPASSSEPRSPVRKKPSTKASASSAGST